MVDEIITLLRSGWCSVLRNPERLYMAHKFLASKLCAPPGIWNDSRQSVDDVIAFLLLNKEEFELCVSK